MVSVGPVRAQLALGALSTESVDSNVSRRVILSGLGWPLVQSAPSQFSQKIVQGCIPYAYDF